MNGATLTRASKGASVTDANGRTMVVYEGFQNGATNIFAELFDPLLLDTNGNQVGWKPFGVNTTLLSTAQDATTGTISASWGVVQKSNNGNGISLSSGSAMAPSITYNKSLNEFIVVWQEQRSGYFQIVGRRIKIGGYSSAPYDAYHALMSDSTLSVNLGPAAGPIPAAPNYWDDDSSRTVSSTWVLSPGGVAPTGNAVNPQVTSITSAGGYTFVYVVFQYFDGTTGGNWQIYGARTGALTVGATDPAYPGQGAAGPTYTITTPIMAAAIDAAGTSITGTGISASAGVGDNAVNPTVTVGVNTPTNDIYIAWQQWNHAAATPNYDIALTSCGSLCSCANADAHAGSCTAVAGTSFVATTAPAGAHGNLGQSVNPKLAVDSADAVYLAWADNTYNTNAYNAYVAKGTAALPTVFPAPGSLLDASSGIISDDTTTSGVSALTSNDIFSPAMAVKNTSVYLIWTGTTSGITNIYGRLYDASVPTETATWKTLGTGGDTGYGISNFSIVGAMALDACLNVNSLGNIDLTYTQAFSSPSPGTQHVFFLRY